LLQNGHPNHRVPVFAPKTRKNEHIAGSSGS
jgi:hypothetical protein